MYLLHIDNIKWFLQPLSIYPFIHSIKSFSPSRCTFKKEKKRSCHFLFVDIKNWKIDLKLWLLTVIQLLLLFTIPYTNDKYKKDNYEIWIWSIYRFLTFLQYFFEFHFFFSMLLFLCFFFFDFFFALFLFFLFLFR